MAKKPVRYCVVDAFTDSAFKGNQAAVCLLEEERDEEWLQAVASEFNLSETCYLTRLYDSLDSPTGSFPSFRLRWFTPVAEVKVACCTVDILKHLSAEEICRNPQGGSKQRLTNLAKHVLNQQRFYPLYPPSEDVPLYFSLASKALHFSSIPDILILPSDLAHFVKVVSVGDVNEGEEQVKCICVNPGRLARGEGGVFFVEINYRGNADSSNASVIRI